MAMAQKGHLARWRRGGAGILLLALVVTMTQAFVAAPAQAHGHDQFRIGNHGYCLDVQAPSGGGNGAPVQLWQCHGGANQKWYRFGDMIVSAWTGRCLDVTGWGGWGAKLQLWDCHGGTNQRWTKYKPYTDYYQYGGYAMGLYTLIAHHNNQAIDVPSNQWYNGQRLQVWPQNGTGAQQFHNSF